MLLFAAEKTFFCHTKLQTIIIKVVLSKVLYLIATWTSYPKPIKEALAILRSPLKLLITSSYKRRTIIFFPTRYRDFQEAGNFFYRRLSACKFFSSPHCADNFFLIPQISHNRGGLCRQFFVRCTSGPDNLFQQFFSCRQFFSRSRYPPGEK